MVFFDRNIIKHNWRAINRNPMQRAGNLIRMRARGSIRRVRRNAPPSPPGTPPRSRWGATLKKAAGPKQARTVPFKMIYNVPIHMDTGQIIGMVGFNTNPAGEMPVPGLHEHGGRAVRMLWNRRRFREVQRRDVKGRFAPKRAKKKFVRRTARYPKRPFMWPALIYARQKIPRLWRNSITRISHRPRGVM